MPPAIQQRVEINHPTDSPGEDRENTAKVVAAAETFERGVGLDFRERCNHFFRLYRGFRRFADDWVKAGANDRDDLLYDAKEQWGAHLHIPISFRTVETMVPRAIAHRPRMLYLPRDPRWEENVDSVRMLIDSQQEQIDIELEFQDVMRNGMINGLGIGKVFWRREWATRRRVKRRMWLPNSFTVGQPQRELVFDDPDFESVDPYDFMWDPYASRVQDCRWVVHRVWLSHEVAMDRIQSGAWNTDSAQALNDERLRQLSGSGVRYDEVWNERLQASGFPTSDRQQRGEVIHELLEFHDGEQVLSVLDRTVCVQAAENPCFGRIPFMVYRPTKVPNQMVGIGEIEPIQHLQRELDTLRSQRRDAATLALAAGYAYDDSAVDEEDLDWAPNAAIPVRNARVEDAIMPLQRQNVPSTAYQDEEVIKQDIDSVVGIADDQTGGPVGTATEAQLVQASLSKRIELKSRRFEVEVVRQAARCFLLLDQRMIVGQRQPIRQPDAGLSMVEAAQAGRWQWFPIGPGELRGEYEIIPEGGSMAAENVPQMRQDAQQIMTLFGNNPAVDPVRPIIKALRLFGERDPESWLKQADPPVPQAALKALQDMGVDPALIQHAIQVGQQQDPRLQGPTAGQMGQMMQPDNEQQEAAPA